MSNYCLMPTEQQKNYAEYLGVEYGVKVKERYLAIATNPHPISTNQFATGARKEQPMAYLKLSTYIKEQCQMSS